MRTRHRFGFIASSLDVQENRGNISCERKLGETDYELSMKPQSTLASSSCFFCLSPPSSICLSSMSLPFITSIYGTLQDACFSALPSPVRQGLYDVQEGGARGEGRRGIQHLMRIDPGPTGETDFGWSYACISVRIMVCMRAKVTLRGRTQQNKTGVLGSERAGSATEQLCNAVKSRGWSEPALQYLYNGANTIYFEGLFKRLEIMYARCFEIVIRTNLSSYYLPGYMLSHLHELYHLILMIA